MAIQRTFIALKPDGVRRRLLPDIMGRFERRGYVMMAAKLVQPSQTLLEQHYEEHKGKPFVNGLINYMKAGPVFAMVWEGENIIQEARAMIGATRPGDAMPGTIRKDYCQVPERNVIHGSDSAIAAEREINLWFSKDEICSYTPLDHSWLFATST